jgi:thioredoxin reductase
LSVSKQDIAIVGAGPYGLSIAAHLAQSGRSFRIFGTPMQFWSRHMPQGMCLKSEGFASDLYDPDSKFTLKSYCQQNNIPYADIGLPVRVETFIAYALAFQQRYVPQLENVQVTSLAQQAEGFELTTATGDTMYARHVVIATGIMNFAHIPPLLATLPASLITHSSQHSDLTAFKDREVAVLGAGASALDIAALLHQAGAKVELIARRHSLNFHTAPIEPRPILERLRAPRSGLGIGWRSRMCTDIPLIFHAMPQSLRLRVVERHLGPAPCWFVRDSVVDRFPMHLGATLSSARAQDRKVSLALRQEGQQDRQIEVDHVIAATGYKVSLSRLGFLGKDIQTRIDKVVDTPILNRHFESSVPGLYFIGAAAANSFGPLLRFAFGAKFAAKRVARHLSAT